MVICPRRGPGLPFGLHSCRGDDYGDDRGRTRANLSLVHDLISHGNQQEKRTHTTSTQTQTQRHRRGWALPQAYAALIAIILLASGCFGDLRSPSVIQVVTPTACDDLELSAVPSSILNPGRAEWASTRFFEHRVCTCVLVALDTGWRAVSNELSTGKQLWILNVNNHRARIHASACKQCSDLQPDTRAHRGLRFFKATR